MSESTYRKTSAAAADDRSEFTTTEFGRRRVAGAPWSARRLWSFVAWPFQYFGRRKAARGRFPKSGT